MRKKLLEIYKDAYLGAEFVYVSKYGGRTYGICQDVTIKTKCMLKPEVEKSLNEFTHNIKYLNETDYWATKKKFENEHKSGHKKYVITIMSTNGIMYSIDEVYFKPKNENNE